MATGPWPTLRQLGQTGAQGGKPGQCVGLAESSLQLALGGEAVDALGVPGGPPAPCPAPNYRSTNCSDEEHEVEDEHMAHAGPRRECLPRIQRVGRQSHQRLPRLRPGHRGEPSVVEQARDGCGHPHEEGPSDHRSDPEQPPPVAEQVKPYPVMGGDNLAVHTPPPLRRGTTGAAKPVETVVRFSVILLSVFVS